MQKYGVILHGWAGNNDGNKDGNKDGQEFLTKAVQSALEKLNAGSIT